jgi:sigma-B regulation protein RsbU (phosphoserine phosphatase)
MPKKIQLKILVVILVTALLPLCGLGVMSYIMMSNMSETAVALSARLEKTAEEETERIVEARIDSELTSIAVLNAILIDKYMEHSESNTLTDELAGIINSIKIGKNGYAVIIDGEGNNLTSPNGISEANDITPVYSASAPLNSNDWSIKIVIPVSEVVEPMNEMEEQFLIIARSTESEMHYARKVGLATVLAAVAAAVILAAFMSLKFSEHISTPIKQLTADVKEIGGGNLDRFISIKTGDEIEELGNAFNTMLAELKIYISDFEKVTADKEHLTAELSVANILQKSVLPRFLQPLEENTNYNIIGSIEPSEEVGGDFYNYYYINDHKLAVVSSDVSSKGIPAALFMLITKTLIENLSHMNKTPAEIFTEANNALCEDNDSGMFAQAFMGILDTNTGVFEYVNAGHYPPLIKRAGSGWEFMDIKPGFVLGAETDVSYVSNELILKKGDIIYLYTGITEAFNHNFERYGRERLLRVLDSCKDKSIYEIIKISRADISDFICGMKQEDDITMLLLEYNDKEMRGEHITDVTV